MLKFGTFCFLLNKVNIMIEQALIVYKSYPTNITATTRAANAVSIVNNISRYKIWNDSTATGRSLKVSGWSRPEYEMAAELLTKLGYKVKITEIYRKLQVGTKTVIRLYVTE